MRYKFKSLPLHPHSSTEEIRASVILSPDDKVPDDVLFPTMEHPNPSEGEPSSACHPVSSCLKITQVTDNSPSDAQKEKNVTESWNIPTNGLEDVVGSDSQGYYQCECGSLHMVMVCRWSVLEIFRCVLAALEGGNGVSSLLPLNVQNCQREVAICSPTERTE